MIIFHTHLSQVLYTCITLKKIKLYIRTLYSSIVINSKKLCIEACFQTFIDYSCSIAALKLNIFGYSVD